MTDDFIFFVEKNHLSEKSKILI